MFIRALTLLALASSLATAKKKEADPKPEEWNIETSAPFSRTWSATLQKGTWMSVDVHPDGSKVVFDLLGDLYVVALAGGKAERITSGPAWDNDPRWSPDGKRLLYVSDKGGNQELWIRDVASGEAKALTKGEPERFGEGAWSPDGRYVAARKRITDTRSIGMCELWLFDVEGGDGIKLTDTGSYPFPVDIAWANDGKSIYFSSVPWRFDYNRDPNQGIYDLHQMDLGTGEVLRLTAESGSAMRPTVNPKDGRIALLRRRGTQTVMEIFDPWTTVRTPVPGLVLEHDNQEGFALNGLYPHMDWTPDGREIVAWDDGTLVRVDPATGRSTPIPWTAESTQKLQPTVHFQHAVVPSDTIVAKTVRWPTVSPDGQSVVFEAFGRLWLQGVAEKQAKAITDGSERALAPVWSPDGKRIAYATWDDVKQGAVHVRELSSGKDEVVTSRPAQYLSPSWSPDGKRLAWIRGSGAPARGHSTAEELWFRLEILEAGAIRDVMPWGYSGGSSRAGHIYWTADSTMLLLPEDEAAGTPNTSEKMVLKAYTLDGKVESTLARWQKAMDVTVSPDGKRLAFREDHRVFEIQVPPLGGQTLELSPTGGPVPVKKVGERPGDWISLSSGVLSWTVANELTIGDKSVVLNAALPRAVAKGKVAYTHARVLTMGKAGVLEDATVVVDGERIVAVGAGLAPPADAKVVDLGGKALVPGLVDVHAHLHYGASDAQPERSWQHEVNLAYGVTTVHDPSAWDDTVFGVAERISAGLEKGPRVFSTGYILYGAKSKDRSRIDSLEDAKFHVGRMKALGAVSVKSYQQPARKQRQWIIQAARELGINVYPEGGGDLFLDLQYVLDGHTGVEHSLPVAPLYDDVIGLMGYAGTGYTPTLLVAYGGVSGERYFYQSPQDLLHDPKFLFFTPSEWVDRSLRRLGFYLREEDDFFHKEAAKAAGKLQQAGVDVNLGGHGQVQGMGPHWELWALAEGMGNAGALKAATIDGARYLGMEKDIGSIEVGKLADFFVVDGDPMQDIRSSIRITEVVKGGFRYSGDKLEPLP